MCTSWKWNHHAETCWNKVMTVRTRTVSVFCWHINPLNTELNPICYLLALLGAHHFLHVSRIRVKWSKMQGVNNFEITGCNLTTSAKRLQKRKQRKHSLHIQNIQSLCLVDRASFLILCFFSNLIHFYFSLFTFIILQFSLHVSDRLVHHQENQITCAASGTFPSFVVISCAAVGAN